MSKSRNDYFNYAHYTSGTNQTKVGNGILKAIIVGTSASGTITLEDAATDTTPVIAVLTCVASVGPQYIPFDIKFSTGLVTKLSTTMDVTVIYE